MFFFPYVRNFTLIYGPFSCQIKVHLDLFYGKFSNYFKSSLNFTDQSLQSELTKIRYTNFVKFRLPRMSFKIEQAFGKMTKKCFCLHFGNSNFNVIFFCTFLKKIIFHILNLHKTNVMNITFYIVMTVLKVVKMLIFQKSLTSHETKLTLLFLSFLTQTTQNQRGIIK